jgi:hypothetical protein
MKSHVGRHALIAFTATVTAPLVGFVVYQLLPIRIEGNSSQPTPTSSTVKEGIIIKPCFPIAGGLECDNSGGNPPKINIAVTHERGDTIFTTPHGERITIGSRLQRTKTTPTEDPDCTAEVTTHPPHSNKEYAAQLRCKEK